MFVGLSQTYAVMMLPLALLFVVYALVTFLWRSNMMRNRDSARWDDPFGPVLLTVLLIIALTIQFFMKVMHCNIPHWFIFNPST